MSKTLSHMAGKIHLVSQLSVIKQIKHYTFLCSGITPSSAGMFITFAVNNMHRHSQMLDLVQTKMSSLIFPQWTGHFASHSNADGWLLTSRVSENSCCYSPKWQKSLSWVKQSYVLSMSWNVCLLLQGPRKQPNPKNEDVHFEWCVGHNTLLIRRKAFLHPLHVSCS